jgi:hypothetical protein
MDRREPIESHANTIREGLLRGAIGDGRRILSATAGLLAVAGIWYGGARATSAARLSRSVEFLRGCGGTVGMNTEDRQCFVLAGSVVHTFGAGVDPFGVDSRWSNLFLRGLTPADVIGVELPPELEKIGGPRLVHRALELVGTFPDLEWLDFACANLSDSDVAALSRLPKLRLLVVSAKSDQVALQELLKTNPACEIHLQSSENEDLRRLQ